jgi:hypothetical protein
MATAQSAADQLAQIQAANMQARGLLLRNSIKMFQPIASGTIPDAGNRAGNAVNVPVRNVGALRRFILKITGTVAQAAAETLNRTALGAGNVLSQVVVTDLNNYQRINTTGWHLTLLSTVRPWGRRPQAWGAAFTSDCPFGVGANYGVNTMPSGVTAAQNFTMFYELPITYSADDLRGLIYASVVNATMNISFTINPNFVIGSGGDPTLSVYQSTTANDIGNLTNLAWTLYQDYFDQVPMTKQGPLVPALDMSKALLLQNIAPTGMATGLDFPITYANYRQFFSTIAIFDNGGTLNLGTDVNYWGLQAANMTFLEQYDPITVQLKTRNAIGDDMPRGTYYFNHRDKPIYTQQQGNMSLVLNAKGAIGNGAKVLVGYEMIADTNQVVNAGTLLAAG